METNRLKKIILKILAIGVISGGLIITLSRNDLLTFEEYNTLIEIYNYEIQKAGGQIILGSKENPISQKNVIKSLNERLLNTSQPASINIENETLTPKDYQLLKSGLFKKAEQ